ncbi:MAG TPA: FxsA family protein [Thermoanaerobaculia bacterium]|nr:FxsA family protein [Thermoanaerobaculia bacterium]
MFARLALLFVLVPLAELALLVWIGRHVGLVPTVALVVATGILGATLARWQGMVAWRRFRAATDAGRLPHREILDGLLVLVAGAVLLTPGLLTDVAGFLLLVPSVRHRVGDRLAATLERRFRRGREHAPGETPLDIPYRVVEDEPTPRPGRRNIGP